MAFMVRQDVLAVIPWIGVILGFIGALFSVLAWLSAGRAKEAAEAARRGLEQLGAAEALDAMADIVRVLLELAAEKNRDKLEVKLNDLAAATHHVRGRWSERLQPKEIQRLDESTEAIAKCQKILDAVRKQDDWTPRRHQELREHFRSLQSVSSFLAGKLREASRKGVIFQQCRLTE